MSLPNNDIVSLPNNRPVLFFDGECNLCNSLIQFIIRHDRKKLFLFAPLQSPAGAEALRNTYLSLGKAKPISSAGGSVDSLLLFYKGRFFIKSAAVLHVARLLGGFWAWLYAGMIFPRPMRDALYDFISRNRYKWWGKRNECMTPTPELRDRFLSS